jgi:hypothetical protein
MLAYIVCDRDFTAMLPNRTRIAVEGIALVKDLTVVRCETCNRAYTAEEGYFSVENGKNVSEKIPCNG